MSQPVPVEPPRRGSFTVSGIPVRIDPSALVLLLLVSGSFQSFLRTFGQVGGLVAIAAVGAMFVVSILVHELGHALAARVRALPVGGITVFALGGFTTTGRARKAADEVVVVGAGPFMSVVVAVAFQLVALLLPDGPVAQIAGGLARLNLFLAIFNVVPAYPLDGGRLLRALLWGLSGREHAATRWAARVGQVFAVAVIATALSDYLPIPFRLPGIGTGLFSALIGLFLLRGATDAHRGAQRAERVASRTAREVMGTVPPSLRADLPLASAAEQLEARPSLLWPVVDPRDGRLIGAVDLARLREVPQQHWWTTQLGSVALDLAAASVGADEGLDEVAARLGGAPGGALLVVQDGQPVGLVTLSLLAGSI